MTNTEGAPRIEAQNELLSIYSEQVHNADESVDNLERGNVLLEPAGLSHVSSFGQVYLGVTKGSADGVKNGIFERPEDVDHTVPIFLELYREAVRNFILQKQRPGEKEQYRISPEWVRTLGSQMIIKAQPGVQFLMHMNAHINNDLAQALYRSGVDPEYHHDFKLSIGKILEEVALAHADELIPLTSARMRRNAMNGSLWYIAWARERAWKEGMALQELKVQEDTPLSKVVELENARQKRVRNIERTALMQGRIMFLGSQALLGAATPTLRVTDWLSGQRAA